jgi:oligopeptide/dipeptide ABC transporter ATP-binding protein
VAGGLSPLLDVRGLTVRFGAREVVSGLSMRIDSGRTLGVVGESGSGKTLSALALLGLVPPPGIVSGHIALHGRELIGQSDADWRATRGARIAMVFQEPMTALNPVMRVGHQIAEVLVLHRGLGWDDAEAEAVRKLDAVGIAGAPARARNYPHQMSGGMRQRAMIAMALAGRPDLLVADEPTTALDVTIQVQILDLLADLQAETGMAMLFISHNLAVVSDIADEILVMYAGSVVERAASEALFAEPLHPYTQGLIATLPDPERSVARLVTIPGQIGDGAGPGCAFAPRCPRADAACRVASELREASPGHDVACVHA